MKLNAVINVNLEGATGFLLYFTIKDKYGYHSGINPPVWKYPEWLPSGNLFPPTNEKCLYSNGLL